VGTVLAGLTGYWTAYRTVTRELLASVKPGPTAPTKAARFSMVVLPFANLSGDPSQDYLADAITENLITGMSRVVRLPEFARNTAFAYKGKNIDVKEIGKDLGVRYVLEGSVQRDQNRVRVNAQLIDAHSGAHLWADRFDITLVDQLQMQDEVLARIASSLRQELTRAEAQNSAIATNPDAWDLAIRCTSVISRTGLLGKEAEVGYRLCKQALEADPNNVLALYELSIGFILHAVPGSGIDPGADLKRADELASRAIAVDANFPWGHIAKANVLRVERRFDDAIAEIERALALDPGIAEAYGVLGETYRNIGQFEKAIKSFDRAIELLSSQNLDLAFWYSGKARAYFGLQQYDQTIEWTRRAIAINPNLEGPQFMFLAAALALSGHEAEARDAQQRGAALSKAKNVAAVKAFAPPPSADPRVRAGFDRFVEGLRKAGMPEE
jgi:TolB-like protein